MIPQELIALPQWVVWKYETRDGKPTKVPYQTNGAKADSMDPRTWTTHATAEAARARFDGIGFVFSADDPYFGVDLDACITDGVMNDWAKGIVERFASYSEVSPSGNGVKLWGRGNIPGERRRTATPHKVEMYDSGRYFTVTGNGSGEIRDCQHEIVALYAEVFGETRADSQTPAPAPVAGDWDAVELAKKFNGQKFIPLWEGNADAYPSRSEADMALAAILAFYTGPDPAKLESIMRASGLRREKWDDNKSYLPNTIKRAIGGRTEFYQPGGGPVTIPEHLSVNGAIIPAQRVVFTPPPETPQAEPAAKVRPSTRANRVRISNLIDATRDVRGKTVSVTLHRGVDEIADELLAASGGWPKSASGVLFVEQPGARGPEVRWLTDTDGLFAWMHERFSVRWGSGGSKKPVMCPTTGSILTAQTKGEFLETVQQSAAERFQAVYELPQEPKMPGIYYLSTELPEPTGRHLEEFLAAFNPETEADAALIRAAILTPGWGGEPGKRPLFVITSKHGMGAGKTATARAIGEVWGGMVDLNPDEKWSDECKRIMSSDDRMARCFFFDNIKGRFEGRGIEAAITAKKLSGHRLYVGNMSRPNDATFFVTLNGPELSGDLAQRAVLIHVGKPKHGTDFIGFYLDYVRKYQLNLVADCLAELRKPAMPIPKGLDDRWQNWAREVLGRVPGGPEAIKTIQERRPDADADAEDREGWGAMVDAMCTAKGGTEAEVSGADLYKRAIEAKLWQVSKDKAESTDRQNCMRRMERLLAGAGSVEGLSQNGQKRMVWNTERTSRSRVYKIRAGGVQTPPTEDVLSLDIPV